MNYEVGNDDGFGNENLELFGMVDSMVKRDKQHYLSQDQIKNNEKLIVVQPGFPALTTGNIKRFADKLEKFLVDGEFYWDLMDRAGLTFSFKLGAKALRALNAFERCGSEDCIKAGKAIVAISNKVRSGSLQVHFKPGSAAERDILPALNKDLTERGITLPSSQVEPVAEDFEGLELLSQFMGK